MIDSNLLYNRIKDACSRRNTTLTSALKAINRGTSATGRWKNGSYPTSDVLIELSDYLDMSLNELVYGEASSDADDFSEWKHILSHISVKKRLIAKDMLRALMDKPD